MKSPAQRLNEHTGQGLRVALRLYSSYVTRDGQPVHRNCGLVTETKPERTNGDSKSRPPRAWIVCYSHYQNSFDWTTSFFSDVFIVRLRPERVNR